NMIPDVTPNGVFYLPPTGWLTSFYNPPGHYSPGNMP
ncbi:aldo/keto reductase, partial [Lactobacillus reuteri]|nr:aldo/keto reductase [Limosilactobacillus reuteri]NMV56611.1 aldo/keto reductase [Limosilactobacillus reuteri]